MKPSKSIQVACLAIVWIGLTPLSGQETAGVRDLTGKDLSAHQLVEALTPDEPPPPVKSGMRGLTAKPSCEFYRKKVTRGIAVRPAAQPVAVEILFAFNSAQISPEAAENLNAIGQALTSSALAPCCFQLEGHTDSIGSEEYNLSLSDRRANSVASYLADNFGIDPDRLLSQGYGESKPIADNASDEGRQKNRRVQIVNLGYGQVE